jgi:excisionase family DNA binding protein
MKENERISFLAVCRFLFHSNLVMRDCPRMAGRIQAAKLNEVSMDQLAFTIADACAAARVGRTALYQAIRSGKLRAVKRGRRTLILNDDMRRWLTSLPTQ